MEATADDHAARQVSAGRLPRSTRTLWQLEGALGAVAATAVALLVLHGPFADPAWRAWVLPVLGTIAVVALVECLLLVPHRHAHHHYAVVDGCITVVRGAVLVRTTVLPLSQVLYVDIRQGPLLRAFGLAEVKVGTVTDPHGLGPVSSAVAEQIAGALRVRD